MDQDLVGSWIKSSLNEEDDVQTYTPLIGYTIVVFTGDRPGAGTDANVSVEIRGESGRSGIQMLDNSIDNFERKSEDVFNIQCHDVGKLVI